MDKKELVEKFNSIFTKPTGASGDEIVVEELDEGWLVMPFSGIVGRTEYTTVSAAMRKNGEYHIIVENAEKGRKLFKGTKANPLPQTTDIEGLKGYIDSVFRERRNL